MNKKKLLILGTITAIVANLGIASLVMAQTDTPVSGTQDIDCTDVPPTITGSFDDITFEQATVQAGIQTTNSVAPHQTALDITDNRTGDPNCGDSPLQLTLAVTDYFVRDAGGANERELINGPDNTFDSGSEQAAVLRANVSAQTCTGCSYYEATGGTDTGIQALTLENDINPLNFPSVTLINVDHGFSGTLNLPAITFTLDIPAAPPAGTFVAELTYTYSA